MTFRVPNQYRIRTGPAASDEGYGNNGAFHILLRANGARGTLLRVIASDGEGWEHVSVSHHARCPNWREMETIKLLFWGDESTVMQLHPPRAQWVNNHPYCLHLWRPIGIDIPAPPSILVGYPARRVSP